MLDRMSDRSSLPAVSARAVVALLGERPLPRPAYRSLADALRVLIADGRIGTQTALPGERTLAGALGLSRTTVTQAYEHLRGRGYLASRPGAASVARLPGGTPRTAIGQPLTPSLEPDVIDLTCAAPRACEGITEAYAAALEQLPTHLAASGYHPFGVPQLRELVAQHYVQRGLPTSADDILITSGAMAALSTIAQATAGPGAGVLVETPGYANTLHLLRERPFRLIGASVEAGAGWDVSAIGAQLATYRPVAAYLIPDFQNPTGALMPEDQREALAQALASHRVLPVVDETVLATGLEQIDLPAPFAAFHPGTVTVGSASKTFWGGLRLGWIRAPRAVLRACLHARNATDLGAPVVEQLALAHLIEASGMRLGQARRQSLREARDLLAADLRAQLPGWRFSLPAGGLSLWVRLPGPHASALAARAAELGLLVASGPRFAPALGWEDHIRLPYTQPIDQLREVVPRLVLAARALGADGPLGADHARGAGRDSDLDRDGRSGRRSGLDRPRSSATPFVA